MLWHVRGAVDDEWRKLLYVRATNNHWKHNSLILIHYRFQAREVAERYSKVMAEETTQSCHVQGEDSNLFSHLTCHALGSVTVGRQKGKPV